MLYPNMRKTFISKMSLNDHYKPLENSTKYSVWVLTVHCRMVVNEVKQFTESAAEVVMS